VDGCATRGEIDKGDPARVPSDQRRSAVRIHSEAVIAGVRGAAAAFASNLTIT
jgi:hypothetical protein